jgi:hypothetical protein
MVAVALPKVLVALSSILERFHLAHRTAIERYLQPADSPKGSTILRLRCERLLQFG